MTWLFFHFFPLNILKKKFGKNKIEKIIIKSFRTK